MREIHQLVHTMSYGDAISSEVVTLQNVFSELGINSRIFSINTHPKYKGLTSHYSEFPSDFSGDVILHYSLGSELNDLYRSLGKAKRTLIYHNLTPARWFKSVNARVYSDIKNGQDELPQLLKLSDVVLADSEFNKHELNHPCEVLPLPIDPSKWTEPANEGIAQILKNDKKTHVLHVGRVAPNKCIEDIIKAFYFLHYHIDENSKLWLIGIDHDTELYSFGLKRLVQELHLSDSVEFLGRRSDSEVRAFYENSSVYVCASEHEGFCLPLIEAMFFKLPVVAYNGSAVPETMGGAGILYDNKDPSELAELMNLAATSKRAELVQAGTERVSQFSIDTFKSRVKVIFDCA